MLSKLDKVEILKTYLQDTKENYADSFKTDIYFYFNGFEEVENIELNFLNFLSSKEEVYSFIDNLTSKIILKYNEDEEQLSDFIFYELNT